MIDLTSSLLFELNERQQSVVEAYVCLPSLVEKQQVLFLCLEARKNVPMRKILFDIDTIEMAVRRDPIDFDTLYEEFKRLSINTAPIIILRSSSA